MRINYIFIGKEKEQKKIEKDIEHRNFLTQICDEVGDEYFIIKDIKNKIKYDVIYSYEDKNTFNFNIELEGRNNNIGEILSEVNNKITKGFHRKDYHIVNIYDEVSEYYCDRGYKIVSKWERKLRELIYRIVIREYGEKWYDEIINEELKKSIKAKGNNNGVENALQELSIGELDDFLFIPYTEESLEKLLLEDLSLDGIKNKTREEIIEVLDRCRTKSIWERFFEDVNIENINKRIDLIRAGRNKIAHNKEFYANEYHKFNKDVKFMIREIDKSIEEIDKNGVMSDEIYNLKEIAQAISKIIIPIQESMKRVATIGIGLQQLFETNPYSGFKKIIENQNMNFKNLD